MSHFEDDDVPIKTRAASKEYRDNFDATFGIPMQDAYVLCEGRPGNDYDGEPHVVHDENCCSVKTTAYSCNACSDTGCVVDPALVDSAETEGDMLVNCAECSIRGKLP